MSAVDVSDLRAGQRVRVTTTDDVTHEGVLRESVGNIWLGIYLRLRWASGQTHDDIRDVEILAEMEPEPWDMAPGSVVLGGNGVTYQRCDDDADGVTWHVSGSPLAWTTAKAVKIALDNGGRILCDAGAPANDETLAEPELPAWPEWVTRDGAMARTYGCFVIRNSAQNDLCPWRRLSGIGGLSDIALAEAVELGKAFELVRADRDAS